jgi:ABC-type antimicrobial peptide transport system permease subunit
MVRVYAVILAIGVVLLIGWIFATYLGGNVPSWKRFDPEERFGVPGRRVVAGLVGFGLAGMSAEFSPLDLSWPVALVLAIAGAGAMVWYAGSVDRLKPERRPVAPTGNDQR